MYWKNIKKRVNRTDMKNRMKLIAFHLPQFHSFPENDEWWGEGFTEWDNVKKAVSLFKGHVQPKIPKDQQYYSMLDVNILKKQTELSQVYGIDGFCYYHYWFNGKLLMERPLELLLQHEEIGQDFCLCWANEPWTRSWDGKSGTVLIAQDYGKQDDWERHFQYLLSFFQDPRYIKVEGSPVLLIYRTNNIPVLDEMLTYWKIRCRECGFEGMYIIEEKNYYQRKAASRISDAVMDFEPMFTLKYGRNIFQKIVWRLYSEWLDRKYHTSVRFYSYDLIWKLIIKRKQAKGKNKCIRSAFVDWDNTPRRKGKGIVFRGGSPEKFEKYLTELVRISCLENQKFLFINAWNEWAEGAYLEPDESNGCAYLEAVAHARKKIEQEMVK